MYTSFICTLARRTVHPSPSPFVCFIVSGWRLVSETMRRLERISADFAVIFDLWCAFVYDILRCCSCDSGTLTLEA